MIKADMTKGTFMLKGDMTSMLSEYIIMSKIIANQVKECFEDDAANEVLSKVSELIATESKLEEGSLEEILEGLTEAIYERI